MNNMTNGSLRSEIIKQQAILKLKAHGFCFENERFAVNTPPDPQYGANQAKP